ncbi:isopeptide-forming domain-containing fimbrial protein [Novosphingobium sp.]|uniref:isopeptide-forming domain-containing fimbrial protein n=1 Tax=Novosphingobium sp. TaxID=1874826 RepID=UPI003BAB1765
MTYRSRLLGAAGILALAVLGANPAHAAGTIAGSTITNTVSVTFTVNSIAQTGTTASDTLTVDRRIQMTVAEVGTTTTTVTPGAVNQVTAFTVVNTSNAPLDLALTAAQQVGGAGAHTNTDTFDVTNVRIFRDVNSNGTYEAGTDTAVTYLDEVAADGSVQVLVVSDVPLGQANGAVAAVTLTATGREAGGAGSQGAALVQTSGANTAGMDTVFADGAGAGDSLRDASFAAKDDYTVSAATLSAIKSSRIISDPINGGTNPKMIPGATIQYCIAITNASGSATATSITVNDPIPANLTYDSAFGVKTNGTATIVSGVATCAADTTGTGTMSSNTVAGTLASVAGGETKTVVFQATIN